MAKFYSKRTGKMVKALPEKERMSTTELAIYLSKIVKAADNTQCPTCPRTKKQGFKVCYHCHQRGVKYTLESESGKAKKAHDKLARQLGPRRKNQKKGRIVNRLMSPLRASEDLRDIALEKPKTILRKSKA